MVSETGGHRELNPVPTAGRGHGPFERHGTRVVNADHAAQLTRDHITAAVHYITFRFTPEQVAAFGDGVALEIDHPAYRESVLLPSATIAELRTDLLP